MSDLISRQAVKELGAECIAKRDENGNLIPLGSIDSLPSVSTEKKGQWIKLSVGYGCSECSLATNESGKNFYRYCPNCGCRMIDPQESEVRNDRNC